MRVPAATLVHVKVYGLAAPALSLAVALNPTVAGAVQGPPVALPSVTIGAALAGPPFTASKKMPLIAAFGPASRVKWNVACPPTCQIQYCPPLNPLTVFVL